MLWELFSVCQRASERCVWRSILSICHSEAYWTPRIARDQYVITTTHVSDLFYFWYQSICPIYPSKSLHRNWWIMPYQSLLFPYQPGRISPSQWMVCTVPVTRCLKGRLVAPRRNQPLRLGPKALYWRDETILAAWRNSHSGWGSTDDDTKLEQDVAISTLGWWIGGSRRSTSRRRVPLTRRCSPNPTQRMRGQWISFCKSQTLDIIALCFFLISYLVLSQVTWCHYLPWTLHWQQTPLRVCVDNPCARAWECACTAYTCEGRCSCEGTDQDYSAETFLTGILSANRHIGQLMSN
jgi:hypothetical protein